MASVDTLVMGRKTFETVLAFAAWPYGDKRVVVLSSRPVDLSAYAEALWSRWPDLRLRSFQSSLLVVLGGNVVLGLDQTARIVLSRYMTEPDIAR